MFNRQQGVKVRPALTQVSAVAAQHENHGFSGSGTASQQTSEQSATNLIGAPGTTMIQLLFPGASGCRIVCHNASSRPADAAQRNLQRRIDGRWRARPTYYRVPPSGALLLRNKGARTPQEGLPRQQVQRRRAATQLALYGRSAPCEEEASTSPQSLVPRPLRALGTTSVPLCHEDRKIGTNF